MDLRVSGIYFLILVKMLNNVSSMQTSVTAIRVCYLVFCEIR
jgi:hypothetical protein